MRLSRSAGYAVEKQDYSRGDGAGLNGFLAFHEAGLALPWSQSDWVLVSPAAPAVGGPAMQRASSGSPLVSRGKEATLTVARIASGGPEIAPRRGSVGSAGSKLRPRRGSVPMPGRQSDPIWQGDETSDRRRRSPAALRVRADVP